MSTEAGQILDKVEQPQGAPAPVDTQATPPKEEPVSPKLAVLMERERQALNRERQAKSQEEKLSDRLKMIEEFENLKKDPRKVDDLLKHLGWDYDRLTQSKLQDGAVPPGVEIQQLRDELDKVKQELKDKESFALESQKKKVNEAETRAVSDFKSEITEYLKSNTQRYELIEFEKADELVFDVIDEHYNRTIDPATGVGKVMPIQEAADKVEKHFEDKYLGAREKNKVKAFWSNMPRGIQDQLKKQDEGLRSASQPPKTLTNNLSPRVQERSKRPPEDQRISQIVADHVEKMRSRFA